MVEAGILVVQENRQRIDLGFHQILEEVCAKRRFGRGANGFARKFDQRPRVVNVAIGHMDTQVRGGRSPTSRPDSDENFIFQGGVELPNGALQFRALGLAGQAEVTFWCNEQHIADASDDSLRNHALGREDDVGLQQFARQLRFTCVLDVTLRAAL